MAENGSRPRSSSSSSRPQRSSSGRPSSGRPSSGRPSSQRSSDSSVTRRSSSERPHSGRPQSDRPRKPFGKDGEKLSFSKDSRNSDRPRRDGDRPRRDGDRPRRDSRGDARSSQGPRSEGGRSFEKKPFNKKPSFGAPHQPRPRIFEPEILEEITGENLEKSLRAELLSLSAENGAYVAKHLESIAYFSEIDPERAYLHGMAAAHHAGRLAVVRESAGYAAYRAGHYEIALKELRAAHRISGDVTAWPVMADCERGLGNPLKALKIAGSPEVKRLKKPEEIEMRIVAAGARRDLGEIDAAVITLQCKELNNESEEWAVRLRYAYADALAAAGRNDEARLWFKKCAEIDVDEVTDAAERLDS